MQRNQLLKRSMDLDQVKHLGQVNSRLLYSKEVVVLSRQIPE